MSGPLAAGLGLLIGLWSQCFVQDLGMGMGVGVGMGISPPVFCWFSHLFGFPLPVLITTTSLF